LVAVAAAGEGATGDAAAARHTVRIVNAATGQDIEVSIAIKPTSSILIARASIDSAGQPTEVITKGRHDPCLLPRFVPMGEAMVAIVLADHWLRWRAIRK
jgi:chorismate synthase